jgi:Zn-dependent protease
MICFSIGGFRLRIHWSFWLLLGLVSAMPGQPVLLLGLAAAACHELGHFAAMLAVGMPPQSLCLSARGGKLQAGGFANLSAEMFALGAGAAVNLLLALLFGAVGSHYAKLFSAINLVLGGFNLLPIQGLDGGRMAALAVGQRWPHHRVQSFAVGLSAGTLVLLLGWSLWLWKNHPQLPTLVLLPAFPAAAFFGWLKGGND